MNALILAAGLGTRFRPHTDILPKPAIPLLNVPLAFYNTHLVQPFGLDCLTVNTHHLPEKIKDIFKREKLGVPIIFSDETKVILGTGGAIKKARESLEGSGTFVVANADVVNGFSLQDALEAHHREQPLATMVVMEHPEAGKKYGAVWVDQNNLVVDISKKKPPGETRPLHFVGVHFVEESVFKYIPAGKSEITSDIYLKAIKSGESVLAYEKEGLWLDAGSLEEYLVATSSLIDLLPRLQHQPFFLSLFRRFWNQFDKRPNLWEGLDCEHLLPLGPKSRTLMGDRCRIHSSTRVSGFVVLGTDVVIEENTVLENVVVNSGKTIPSGSKLKNALVL